MRSASLLGLRGTLIKREKRAGLGARISVDLSAIGGVSGSVQDERNPCQIERNPCQIEQRSGQSGMGPSRAGALPYSTIPKGIAQTRAGARSGARGAAVKIEAAALRRMRGATLSSRDQSALLDRLDRIVSAGVGLIVRDLESRTDPIRNLGVVLDMSIASVESANRRDEVRVDPSVAERARIRAGLAAKRKAKR